jgi:glutamate 5-kinase
MKNNLMMKNKSYEKSNEFDINNYNLIMIKIGTNTIIKNGELDKEFLTKLAIEVNELTKLGKKVCIVSSGAVGLGKKAINFTPTIVKEQQGLAAIGQIKLMQEFSKRFEGIGLEVGQFLLSQQDLLNQECLNNIKNAFDFLFEHKIIPIVNENDVVATEELRKRGSFSDNDALASLLATKLTANILIIITEKGGLIGKNGEVLKEFHEANELANLENTKGGRGGIESKLQAITFTTQSGCDCFITSSKEITKLQSKNTVGTFCNSNRNT